ncbi:hypothetical protein THRCLA_20779 [Thraustotheca clavata]|uniref:BZIP domain-containing protein n=1 Tax=Thraustotheca clavata TaxID=74557 RepID=A0A1W0A3J2_9STRA|nr:hypothetical protein THRCLA_20779 [Thraustotheca clavata]
MQPQQPRRLTSEWIPYELPLTTSNGEEENKAPAHATYQSMQSMSNEPTPWLQAFIEEDEHVRLEIKKERHRRDSSRYRERKLLELESLRNQVSDLETQVDTLQEAHHHALSTSSSHFKAICTKEKLQLDKATDERTVLEHTVQQQKNLINFYTKRLQDAMNEAKGT